MSLQTISNVIKTASAGNGWIPGPALAHAQGLGLVEPDGERYRLTPAGRRFAARLAARRPRRRNRPS